MPETRSPTPPPSQSYIHYEKHMPTNERRGEVNRDFAHRAANRIENKDNIKYSSHEASSDLWYKRCPRLVLVTELAMAH